MTSFDVSYKGIESSNFESPLPNLTYIYIYIYIYINSLPCLTFFIMTYKSVSIIKKKNLLRV